MPKHEKQHEKEAPKESTTKPKGGQESMTVEQQAKDRGEKKLDFVDAPAEEEKAGPRHDHVTTHEGGKRINAGRQQHDEADKNSETNRGDRVGHAKGAEDDKQGAGPSKGGKGGNSGAPDGR